MKKKLAILVSMMMAATMFAACGDDSSSSAAPAADDASSVAETTTAPEESKPEETTAEETTAAEESAPADDSSATDSAAEPTEFSGTLNTDGEYPGDWGTPNFVIDDDGNVLNFFNVEYFEKYKETGCSVTINYTFEKTMDMTTLEESYYEYYLLGPCFAVSWGKMYAEAPEGTPYVTGLPEELDARVEKNGDLKPDFTGEYFMQSDGYIVFCQDKDGNWSSDSVTINLTPECIAAMEADIKTEADGSQWGGMIFQTYGINVTSVTLGDPVEAAE